MCNTCGTCVKLKNTTSMNFRNWRNRSCWWITATLLLVWPTTRLTSTAQTFVPLCAEQCCSLWVNKRAGLTLAHRENSSGLGNGCSKFKKNGVTFIQHRTCTLRGATKSTEEHSLRHSEINVAFYLPTLLGVGVVLFSNKRVFTITVSRLHWRLKFLSEGP